MNNKSKKRFWIVLILVNIIILDVMFSGIYGKTDYSLSQNKKTHLIGASYMTMNNEFYKILSEEISARAEAEGDRLVLRDPALDAGRQIEQIREMLDLDIDVLVVAPVDWQSLESILEDARAEGILIVVVDTNVSREDLADCTILSDNYNAGVLIGQYFLKQRDTAKVVVMTHENAKSGQDRVQGFMDTIKGHKGIEIADKIECEGQLEIAMPKLQEAIDNELEFDSVFCLNDLAGVGVVAALEENRILDKIDVYGVDASPDSKALIKENMMAASVAQFPSEIGTRTADVIYKLLNGEEIEKHILVPVKLVTKDNVEDFGIDRWQ